MKMWHFYCPNIIYGEDALDYIEKIKGERCFIVTDKTIEDLGYLKILTDKLDKFGKKYSVFTDVIPDPHEEDVLIGKKKCIEYGPDLIIAFGGGSVIDSAKAIWAMYEYPNYVLDDINAFNDQMYDFANKAKMIAIPTTSGTGAEVTWATVISRFQDGAWRKIGTNHASLIPTYAIVDPIFPKGMPQKLTVNTAFDALAQAMEGYTSSWRNEFSEALGLKTIELIFKYLPIVFKDGENMEARDFLHQAASMSGLAYGNSQVHLAHTMGHSLSAIFPTHHGQAVGLFLPYITQYCLNAPGETNETIILNSNIAKKLGWARWDDDDRKAAVIVIDKIKELQEQVNFITNLNDLGINREDLEKNLSKLIGLCFQDVCNTMAPRIPNRTEYIKLYTYAYEGRDIDF